MQYLTIFHKGRPTGQLATVDDEDFKQLNSASWYFSTGGYVASSKFGLLHRHLTACPKGMVVDHINHDPLDNRKSNLRVCTTQQNIWNHPPRKFKYGYKGIKPARDGSARWQSYITVNWRTINLGVFDTPEAAALAHNDAARLHYGEYAYLNEVAS